MRDTELDNLLGIKPEKNAVGTSVNTSDEELDHLLGIKNEEPPKPSLFEKFKTGVHNLSENLEPKEKQFRYKMAEAIGSVPDKLHGEEDYYDYGNKYLNFARNINRGAIDLIGMPFKLGEWALKPEDEIDKTFANPKSHLKERGSQLFEMVRTPFDKGAPGYFPKKWRDELNLPDEYTKEKFYDDPVGRIANLGMALGTIGAVGSLATKPFKSLKKIQPEEPIVQPEVATLSIPEKPQPSIIRMPPKGGSLEGIAPLLPERAGPSRELLPSEAQQGIIGERQSSRPLPQHPTLEQILNGDLPIEEQMLVGSKARLAKNSELIKTAFPKLFEERGSFSAKDLDADGIAQLKAAREAQRELKRRAADLAKETGEDAAITLEKLGLSKAQIKSINEPEQTEFVTRLNKKGEPVEIKSGNQKVPTEIVSGAQEWKDLFPLQSQYKDIVRASEKVAGKDFPKVDEFIIKPREQAVTNLIQELSDTKASLKKDIIEGLGIKPRSKESAAVQRFGEKELSLDQLKQEFPNKWGDIVKADNYFRERYDKILSEINAERKNQNRELIPRRENYYTHIQELEGLLGQLSANSAIDPRLAGISEFVKPTKSFNPFSLKRTGGEHIKDAVQAFDRYLGPSLKEKHLMPVIARQRAFANALAEKTLETKNVNNFINMLHENANTLAGKTNPMDRFIQDKVLGRKAMKVVDWASRRLGANTIVGNLGSTIMQTGSLPITTEGAGLFNTAKGLYSTLADAIKGIDPAIEKSNFLKRRYLDVEPVTKTLTQKASDVASIPMKYFERYMVESAWRANFSKALETLKESDAIKLADRETAKQIGDRSLGAKPAMFDSRVGNLGMMFQFEVNNMMQRLGHDIGFKSPARMAKVMIYSHLFNTAMEQLMGRRPLLDPIQAGADAVTQKKDAKDSTLEDLLKRGGRIGGEILSNMPAGQTLAQIIPDSQRKKYLGKTDVGMYPGGAPLVSAIQRGIKDPKSLLTSFVTPFGGGQISKILKAYNASQDVKDLSMGEKIKANIFGPSSAGLVKRKGKYRRLKKEKE